MKLITFTEVETTSPAEELVFKETEGAVSPEATASAEELASKETEGAVSPEAVLTIGAVEEGEDTLLFTGNTQETTATTETAAAIGFEPMNFVTNLQYMGTGMVTIFIVIGVIILATQLINKIFSKH